MKLKIPHLSMLTIATLFLCSCKAITFSPSDNHKSYAGTSTEVTTPDAYPEYLGELDSERLNHSECPNISGKYLNAGNSLLFRNGIVDGISENGYRQRTPAILIPYSKEPAEYVSGSDEVYASIFTITQKDQNNIELIESDLNPKAVGGFLFKAENKDFRCSKGWIIFPSQNASTSNEWSGRKYNTDTRVTRLKSGKLLVKYKQNILTSSMFGKSQNIDNVEFVRFFIAK